MRALITGTLALGLALLTADKLVAGPEDVKLPQNYQSRFVLYQTVDNYGRKQVRNMYVNPEAHASAKPGEDLPDGTVLIMEAHDAKVDADGNLMRDAEGRLIALEPIKGIFLMEKNAAWSTDNENWDYAWYQPDGTLKPDAKYGGCFTCHTSRVGRDYTFTYWKFVSDRAK